nr:MAG TPA: hypothetical protein [Bacteriophage sp.]
MTSPCKCRVKGFVVIGRGVRNLSQIFLNYGYISTSWSRCSCHNHCIFTSRFSRQTL